MIDKLEIIEIALLAFILNGVWLRMRSREMQRKTELKLWMTVHRVAMRHGIVIPEGMSLDEAGTYVEQMIDAARKE